MTAPHTQGSAGATDKVRVVEDFLAAMERLDREGTLALCAPEMVWVNAPFTTSKGKRQFEKVMRSMLGVVTLFRVDDLKIHEREDGVVVTDRVDVIEGSGVRMRIAIDGEFEVRDGLITRWTDRFSWPDSLRQALASLPGVLRFLLAERRRG